MRRRIVPEFDNARMAVENLLHNSALHAAPAAVHEPHLIKTRSGGGVDVLGNDGRDVARRECMQIELTLDRDSHTWR